MTQDEQITLYALGALDERERVEVERQLSASVNLRAQLAEELAMLHALGATVDPVVPSAAAKKRVMDRLIAVPVTPRRQIQKELPRRSSWLDTLRWLLSGLAVAATAIAAVLGLQLYNLRTEMTALQTTLRATQQSLAIASQRTNKLDQDLAASRSDAERNATELAKIKSELDQTQTALVKAQTENQTILANVQASDKQLAQARSELAVISQPGVRTAAIPPFNRDYVSSTATLIFSPQSNTALVSVANLPTLGENQSYQVWLIRGDQRVPSSVFNTTEIGEGRLLVQSREPLSSFQRIGITVEPAGGSASPNPDPKGMIFLGRVA